MTPVFDKAVRVVANFATAPMRFMKRTAARFQKVKQREVEAERLDRLRNPGNYQGR